MPAPRARRRGPREVDVLEARRRRSAERVIPAATRGQLEHVLAIAPRARCGRRRSARAPRASRAASPRARPRAPSAPGPSTSSTAVAERRAAVSRGVPSATTVPFASSSTRSARLGLGEVVGREEHRGAARRGARCRGSPRAAARCSGSRPTVGSSRMRRRGGVQRGARDVGEAAPAAGELARALVGDAGRAPCARARQRNRAARVAPRSRPASAGRELEVLADREERDRRWVPGTRARGGGGPRGARLHHVVPEDAGTPASPGAAAWRAAASRWSCRRRWVRAGRPARRRPRRRVEAVERPRAAVVAAEAVGRDRGGCSRRLRLARQLAVGERRRRASPRPSARLDEVVVRAQGADRVGVAASPVSANAWQRQPPKSTHFRSQVDAGLPSSSCRRGTP